MPSPSRPTGVTVTLAVLAVMAAAPIAGAWITEASSLWPATTLSATLATLLLASSLRAKAPRLAVALVALDAVFLLNAVYFASYFMQDRGFNHAFFYHARTDIIHAGLGEFAPLAALFAGALLALNALTILACRGGAASLPAAKPALALAAALLLAGSLIASPPVRSLAWHAYPDRMAEVTALLTGKPAEKRVLMPNGEKILADLAAEPRLEAGRSTRNRPPRRPPHLVLIYLESVERRYFDQRLFPGLLPGLSALRERAVDFPDMIQGKGTGWTIAGMTASQCGYPLLSSFRASGNDLGILPTFMPDAVCLGDLLDDAGYALAFMGGADHRFAGKGNFYRSHGFERVAGHDDLQHRLADPAYRHHWGLHDDTLLDLAFEDFLSLAAGGRPVGLVLLTLDTHHPDGYPSASCKPYQAIDNPILQAVHCTDQLVSDFVARIRDSPHGDDTVIAIASDHLAMRNSASAMLNEPTTSTDRRGDARRLTFFVDMPDRAARRIAGTGMHYDIAPTLLDLLGIAIEGQLGLGRSLLDQDGYLPSLMDVATARKALPDPGLRDHIAALWSLTPLNLRQGLSIDVARGEVTFGGQTFDLRTKPTTRLLPTLFSFDAHKLQLSGLYQADPGEPEPDELTRKIRKDRDAVHLAIGPSVSLAGLLADRKADRAIRYVAARDRSTDDRDVVVFMGKADRQGLITRPRSGRVDISAEEAARWAK